MCNKLQGQVALITGSGRGIGKALALKLASKGVRVVINDLDQEPTEDTVAQIKATGGEAIAVVGSITSEGFADNFIAGAVKAYGTPDMLINNAGYTWDSMIHKADDEQFDAMYEIHLKAPFQLNRAFVRAIRDIAKKEAAAGIENFRKIVNISSIAGVCGNTGQVNYSSMKAGLSGMTKTLAKELGRLKVNVNCVAFGVIDTRLTEATDEKKSITVDGREIGVGVPEKVHAAFSAAIPLGRSGSAEEAADGVYLFCTPESNYISGQVLLVAGGLSL
ncbi:SDR family NAD(P)-dependent oxidoreductase [Colwellia sp. MSW7]|uniref:SDR family NAD(P)-dependent oxidoreductase n=1 Tax=Colwellia maritima TaxID=2912588 RepID=A0ABS9X5U6_9GAMM|nr:SDR family NAD(P)-dependent oxidoreductase [Colwellia maritima]MCI2285591.1 SDR family NAD(P)-dependent oxidoreductase [Colwellia maritima]